MHTLKKDVNLREGKEMKSCAKANVCGIINTSLLAEYDIETLRRIALEKISQLSDEDCADIMFNLKERGVL